MVLKKTRYLTLLGGKSNAKDEPPNSKYDNSSPLRKASPGAADMTTEPTQVAPTATKATGLEAETTKYKYK